MKKIIDRINLEKILFLFIVIQPILDYTFLNTKNHISLFNISISVIVRYLLLFILLFITILKNKNCIKLKKYIWYGIYFVLLLLFIFFHHINAINFHSLVPNNFSYNLLDELIYISKMMIPFIVVVITYNIINSNYKNDKLINSISLLISLTIIITNLFNISLGSYSNETIKNNIFSWFTNGYSEYTYFHLASKGWFTFANQIACLLVSILPINLYIYFKNNNKYNFLIILCNMIAMLMLGTKVSTFGFGIVIFVFIILSLFFNWLHKIKFNIKIFLPYLLIIILYLALISFSPAIGRNYINKKTVNEYKDVQMNVEKEINNYYNPTNNETVFNKLEYVENYYEKFSIHKIFITKSYPYQYDYDFWYEIMQSPIELRLNYRYLEERMIKRVIEINDNKNDKLFGITNVRMQNIFNIERDYVSQYYSVGIFGLLLLIAPYFVLLIYLIFKLFLNIKNQSAFEISIYLLSITIVLIVAYFSGNILESLLNTIILGYMFGMCLKKQKYLFQNKI